MTDNAAAKTTLQAVAEASLFIRWITLQGLQVDIVSPPAGVPLLGVNGAAIRISQPGMRETFAVSLFQHEEGGLWFAHFGDVLDEAEVGMVLGGRETMPSVRELAYWLDSDDVVACFCVDDVEWDAFRVLRSLEIALCAGNYAARVSEDDVACLMWGASTFAQLAAWLDDVEDRMFLDTRDVRSRMEVFVSSARRFNNNADDGGEWVRE